MIAKALKKIIEDLNIYLDSKYPNATDTNHQAEIVNIQKSNDPQANNPGIKVALINIEEDKVYKNHLTPFPSTSVFNTPNTVHPMGGIPTMRINFYVLFAFNPKEGQSGYLNSISLATHVLRYFTSTPYQEVNISPTSQPNICTLEINYHNISLEDSNNMWSNLGGEQKPYAMYQIKMMEIESDPDLKIPLTSKIQIPPKISSPDLHPDGSTIFNTDTNSQDYGKVVHDTNQIQHKKNKNK
ncbi:Pvc16 family protein [Aquimarina longa]|uniref:Pvc16 family protein n=1 Tax=Aquimarina longa TaxID=1080221 RepID=UPI0007823700|nr:Pvc16 family protein [Aquimarina longa]